MDFSASKRINPRSFESGTDHWASIIADEVIKAFPDTVIYTAAAGISPSGIVHFGNFRDVMTCYAVIRALQEKGKKTRFVFSWDNFDRLRKVPVGVDESFAQYIGMPLSKVPDPTGKFSSYAESFQVPFVKSIEDLGIELEYKDQSVMYQSGIYADKVIHALKNRKEIGKILFSLMTEKAIAAKDLTEDNFVDNYYPVSVYSKFTGKDNTTVLSFDDDKILTYRCEETKQQDTIDITKDFIYKLGWKVDWPMRWDYEGVNFEPGGHDHASPGSSFDVSSIIAEKIYNTAPVFVEYKFVGIQGIEGKMSGSKGGALSPSDLLEIYEPRLLKWQYLKKTPAQPFNLSFDSEINRQYDEYDIATIAVVENTADNIISKSINYSLASADKIYTSPTSFRQAVSFGQIMQWDQLRVEQLFTSTISLFDTNALSARLPRAKAWLELYNRDEMIVVRNDLNTEYISNMEEGQINNIKILRDYLEKGRLEDLETFMYNIPKDESLDQKQNAVKQRAFFKDIYNLLISKNTGPRLATFLQALDRDLIIKLLNI